MFSSCTMQSVDELLPYLEDLKISAFRKAELIKNAVHGVTIGPNSSPAKDTEIHAHLFNIPSSNNLHNKTTVEYEKVSQKILTFKQIANEIDRDQQDVDEVIDNQAMKFEIFDAQQSANRTRHSIFQDQNFIQHKQNQEQILPFRQIAKEIELERQQDVKGAIDNHSRKFEIFDAQQKQKRAQQWILQQQKFIKNMQDHEQKVKHAIEEYEDNKLNNQKKLTLHFQELEDQRKKSAELLETKKKEKELLKECLDLQNSFHSTYHEIIMTIKNCQDEKLKAGLKNVWKQCKELNDFMSVLISKCKSINISIEEKKKAANIVRKANQLKSDVNAVLLQNEQLQKQLEEQNQAEEASAILSSSASDSNDINIVRAYVQNSSSEVPIVSSIESSLDKYVSQSNFRWYNEIMEFYEKYIDTYKDLLRDDRFKQFRFDCKKAINLSVNAISAVNSEHLCDKYVKLSNLLQGKNVFIGDFQINASQHPQGIQFSTDLLAKKFVLQGDLMISSNPEAAFCFATIIISLWNDSAEFGKLLLTHFFKECPYLLPIYIPKTMDQTDKEFYMSQGYRYIDDHIEKQDKFLKRMTGIMRLYFAILISHPKQGQNRNPHNIKRAWAWLVSVLKLNPRIDITATMLHTFLETVGCEMQNCYKTQFFKLLRFLVEIYIPSLKKIDTGGPVTRLECLIQEFKENRNQFKSPSGILLKTFW